MRRRKKIIKNLLKILAAVAFVLIIYFAFFRQQEKINTANTSGNNSKTIELSVANEPKIEIILPEKIYEYNTNTLTSTNNNDSKSDLSDEKTYTPITSTEEIEVQKKYLVAITSESKVEILIGDDSEELLTENTAIEIGGSYEVEGITERLKTTYSFSVAGYKYPIILILSQTGNLYYIDTEQAFQTGKFQVAGKVENLSNVDRIYTTKVEQDGSTYDSAVIVTKTGEGYEFSLNMINK